MMITDKEVQDEIMACAEDLPGMRMLLGRLDAERRELLKRLGAERLTRDQLYADLNAMINERDKVVAERYGLRNIIEGIRAFLQKAIESDVGSGWTGIIEGTEGIAWEMDLPTVRRIREELNRLDAAPPKCERMIVRHGMEEEEILAIFLPKDMP
jgi:hypothetical protein